MTKQPKALWLAEYLENCRPEDAPVFATATELRRLHSLNQELLEALKELLRVESTHDDGEIVLEVARHNAKAAIAKATGEQA